MRILIASVHIDRANLSWLKDYNRSFLTPFEHYWCVRTLIQYVLLMTDTDRAEINAGLETRWKEIQADSGRAEWARRLRDLMRPGAPLPQADAASRKPRRKKRASSKTSSSDAPA